jgi:hypothetical protein
VTEDGEDESEEWSGAQGKQGGGAGTHARSARDLTDTRGGTGGGQLEKEAGGHSRDADIVDGADGKDSGDMEESDPEVEEPDVGAGRDNAGAREEQRERELQELKKQVQDLQRKETTANLELQQQRKTLAAALADRNRADADRQTAEAVRKKAQLEQRNLATFLRQLKDTSGYAPSPARRAQALAANRETWTGVTGVIRRSTWQRLMDQARQDAGGVQMDIVMMGLSALRFLAAKDVNGAANPVYDITDALERWEDGGGEPTHVASVEAGDGSHDVGGDQVDPVVLDCGMLQDLIDCRVSCDYAAHVHARTQEPATSRKRKRDR